MVVSGHSQAATEVLMAKKKPASPVRSSAGKISTSGVSALTARAHAANKAREARARKAIAQIRVLFRKAAGSAWDLGHALAEFLQDKLYTALGYSSFADCLKGEKLISENQAFKLIRVSRRFSRDELATIGSVEKADALIGYTDATEEDDTPAGLMKADPIIGGKRVSKSSSAHLDQEAKVALAKRKQMTPANADRVNRAKGALARQKWVAKQIATLGWKAMRVTTKGAKIVVELDVEAIDSARTR